MITIVTDNPVALDSLDHTHPHGTAADNSTMAEFNAKVFALWPKVRLLDIGCAGGGLVKSIIDDGGIAVGVEGSDYSQRIGRAEWAIIPDNLFTADATAPFTILNDQSPMMFDVVTSWEMFEHIPVEKLSGVFDNVRKHLAPTGVFVCSVCTISTGLSEDGTEHHVTIHPWEWWLEQFAQNGFKEDRVLRDYFDPDWVRGPNLDYVNDDRRRANYSSHSRCTALRSVA